MSDSIQHKPSYRQIGTYSKTDLDYNTHNLPEYDEVHKSFVAWEIRRGFRTEETSPRLRGRPLLYKKRIENLKKAEALSKKKK